MEERNTLWTIEETTKLLTIFVRNMWAICTFNIYSLIQRTFAVLTFAVLTLVQYSTSLCIATVYVVYTCSYNKLLNIFKFYANRCKHMNVPCVCDADNDDNVALCFRSAAACHPGEHGKPYKVLCAHFLCTQTRIHIYLNSCVHMYISRYSLVIHTYPCKMRIQIE